MRFELDHDRPARPAPLVHEALSGDVATFPASIPAPAAPRGPSPPPRAGSSLLTVWGFTESDRRLLTVLLALMTALLTAHLWKESHRNRHTIRVDHPQGVYPYQVSLNSATWVEWAQLDGIGEKLARRIVAERELHGPFQSVDDLRRVKGIGPKTVEKLKPYVVVEPVPSSVSSDQSVR